MHFVSWRKTARPSPPTPLMSSKTTFPHRIGGSHHKFPENSQPFPPPPHPSTDQSLTSCLKNRRFSNFSPAQPQRKPQRSLPGFLSIHLLSLGRKTIGSRSWRWWRRKSKPCSSNLMMQRSVSWRSKGSWTLSWNSAKKWENSPHSHFPFLKEKKKKSAFTVGEFYFCKKLLLCFCYTSPEESFAELVVSLSFSFLPCAFTVDLELVANFGRQGHSLVDFCSALLFKSNPPTAVKARPLFHDCVSTFVLMNSTWFRLSYTP